ncbi:MAG: beta-lactamase family protein [Roseibacillus sp.]|nr:beta-lactamase family protein [Roseibacillus sp.]
MTLRLLLPLVLCCCALPAGAEQRLPMTSPAEVGMSADKLGKIDEVVTRKFIKGGQLAGASVIVARRGKVIHFGTYGMRDRARNRPMERDTIVRMYSMTKAIISVAAMILVEEGKLALDAPISKYVPQVNAMKVGTTPAQDEMTVRDILRHTAGFPNNVTVDRLYRRAGFPSLADSTLREMTERLNNIPLRSEPGTKWHYSFGTDALAHLVEVGSGNTIDVFLEERIFKPLGMIDTAFYCPKDKWERFSLAYDRNLNPVTAPQPGTSGPFSFETPPKFLSGGGGLVSTGIDYMRFCLMLSGMGEFDGARILKRKTVQEMTSNQLPDSAYPINRPPKGRGFGLGFAVRVEKIDSEPSSIGEYEWLGGAGTEFWISPRDELVVITLSQALPMRDLGATVKPLVYSAIKE